MPTYKVTLGDKSITVTAETAEQAATMGRLRLAGEQSVAQAEEGAMERSEAPDLTGNPTQILAKSRERTAEGLPGYATPGGLALVAGAAAPGAALAIGKDAALYGAAEGAEKMLGLPSWVGEAVGAVSPTKQLGKLLLGGVFGGAKKAATEVAAKEAAELAAKTAAKEEARRASLEAAAKKAADRAAMEAERVALRKKSLEIAERRLAMAEERAAAKAAKVGGSGAGKVAPEAAPSIPSVAQSRVAVPASTGIPVPAADSATIVLKLQQQMGTSEGRKVVRELLAKMPPEQAAEIKRLLFKGQEHPATVLGKLFDPTKSQVGRSAKPGYELARLLGQVQ